jgi:hypothetical protein
MKLTTRKPVEVYALLTGGRFLGRTRDQEDVLELQCAKVQNLKIFFHKHMLRNLEASTQR